MQPQTELTSLSPPVSCTSSRLSIVLPAVEGFISWPALFASTTLVVLPKPEHCCITSDVVLGGECYARRISPVGLIVLGFVDFEGKRIGKEQLVEVDQCLGCAFESNLLANWDIVQEILDANSCTSGMGGR
jgi:hypothetical protein